MNFEMYASKRLVKIVSCLDPTLLLCVGKIRRRIEVYCRPHQSDWALTDDSEL